MINPLKYKNKSYNYKNIKSKFCINKNKSYNKENSWYVVIRFVVNTKYIIIIIIYLNIFFKTVEQNKLNYLWKIHL